MKIIKCDVCGYTQSPENNNRNETYSDDFFEIYHDNKKYDLCNTCINKYRHLKHDLTAAFIFYPDRKIEIKISEVKKNDTQD